MFIIKRRNWIIPFKLTRVGELSLAERLQGRYGNPPATVTVELR